MEEKFFTASEVQKELGIGKSSLYAMMREGRLEYEIRLIGGRNYKVVSSSEVDRLRALMLKPNRTRM